MKLKPPEYRLATILFVLASSFTHARADTVPLPEASRLQAMAMTEHHSPRVGRLVHLPAASRNEQPTDLPAGSRAFDITATEVTVGLFRQFIRETGYTTDARRRIGNTGCAVWNGKQWRWSTTASWLEPGFAIRDDQPVVCVTWHDIRFFVQWLNDATGQHFRLPTEAEWVYAAAADAPGGSGLSTPQALDHKVWHAGNSGAGLPPAGSKQPNEYGLHDMAGSVWEWCEDPWQEGVEASASTSPDATIDERYRIVRGGSWADAPDLFRSRLRDGIDRLYPSNNIGFRLVREHPGSE